MKRSSVYLILSFALLDLVKATRKNQFDNGKNSDLTYHSFYFSLLFSKHARWNQQVLKVSVSSCRIAPSP